MRASNNLSSQLATKVGCFPWIDESAHAVLLYTQEESEQIEAADIDFFVAPNTAQWSSEITPTGVIMEMKTRLHFVTPRPAQEDPHIAFKRGLNEFLNVCLDNLGLCSALVNGCLVGGIVTIGSKIDTSNVHMGDVYIEIIDATKFFEKNVESVTFHFQNMETHEEKTLTTTKTEAFGPFAIEIGGRINAHLQVGRWKITSGAMKGEVIVNVNEGVNTIQLRLVY